MAAAISPPQQFKQPSRKGKKAWRKNIDVSDVQQGLEDARDEIVSGGIIAEKSSKDLFTVDTAGDKAIQKAYNKTQKPLKSDEILSQRSAVPVVSGRKRSGSATVTDGVLESKRKRRREGGVSHKEMERLKQKAFGGEAVVKDIVDVMDTTDHDPWAAPPLTENPYPFLEPPRPIREPVTLKHAPLSLVASGKKVPAVLKPRPGTSYNPAYQDWDELLTREGKKEISSEKKRMEEAEIEREKAERVAASAREAEKAELDEDSESAWEGFQSELDEQPPSKRPQRKTKAERNKIKRRKEEEQKSRWEQQMRRKEQQARELQTLSKDTRITSVEANSSSDSFDDENIDDTILRRRPLGKFHIPKPPLELLLPDELTDSLRLLKPEGNLLRERYRNMLVRGKMETRRAAHQHKKPKRVTTEKWSYKDFTI